jgi:pyruvate/2-oxoglutarate dehydrogenase complex dihydrolipoamide acyltransferase (E2) component
MTPEDFVKQIRKPLGLYTHSLEAIAAELQSINGEAAQAKRDTKIADFLSKEEQEAWFDALLMNLIFPKGVHTHFDKSCFGLPLFGSTVYSHMNAGLGNYAMQKMGTSNIEEALRYITYYRTPVIPEELYRLGYSQDQVLEIIAKQYFMQYWSGSPFTEKKDPLIFNHMVRSFYPCDSHVGSGSTDLGRDCELQAARLFCMGKEGMRPPVTVLNTGDTGFFTDGAIHALQHIAEARELGYAMPLIYLINSNNAAISARLDYGERYGDNGDYAVERIEKRFEMWGERLIEPGFTTWAHDVSGGIEAMRMAVDQVLETGRPTYVIARWPFRPGGHASDQSPAPEEMILDQFVKYRDVMVNQLISGAPEGMSPGEIADRVKSMEDKVMGKVEHAITGVQVLDRKDIRELCQPGSETVLAHEAGEPVKLNVNYLLGKGQKSFAGMGSDIFGRAINEQMNLGDEDGRAVRYVHQENHHQGKHDTRGGVYGELNPIEAKHMDKFVGFMPQESQVVQVGAAYRSVLPPGNRVFVKGPHTIFNEHARDHIKYAAYRYCDAGSHANHIYLFDGGSLAFQEKDAFIDKETGDEVIRDLFLARVGEHHNTPEYSSFAGDANTVMALPMDMNVLSASMPEMVRLHDMGRMILGVAPTASFGMLHPSFPMPDGKKCLTVNDFLQVDVPGKNKPLNGKKLIVISWGPDTKMVARVLAQENIEAEIIVINYNRVPNALVTYLDDLAIAGTETEIVCVDANPNSALLGPVMSQLRMRLGWPRDLIFSECTIANAYVPYGLGDPLLQPADFLKALRNRDVIEGGDQKKFKRTKFVRRPSGSRSEAARAETAAKNTTQAGSTEIVNAPMDGEAVTISFIKKPGDTVVADELVAEVESDKATIEINAPVAGVIEEYFVEEKKEMDVTPETRILSITVGGGDASGGAPVEASPGAKSTATGEIEIVNAPMDGEGVVVSFAKKVGDTVRTDDLVAEIESDKATIEVNAPCDGIIKEFYVPEKKDLDLTSESKIFALEVVSATSKPPGASPGEPAFGHTPKVIKEDTVGAMQSKGQEDYSKKTQVVPLSRYQLSMVKNMTVQPTDTNVFQLLERVDFKEMHAASKQAGVNPVAFLVKKLGDAAAQVGMNKKLTKDRKGMQYLSQVDIGVAVDVEGQLRTAVVRDVSNKSAQQIRDDIARFVSLKAKLPLEDQDLANVCFTVSSMGKDASELVIPVLPKGTSGILGVGRVDDQGKTALVATLCHATLTGVEGAKLMTEFHRSLK